MVLGNRGLRVFCFGLLGGRFRSIIVVCGGVVGGKECSWSIFFFLESFIEG